LLRTAGTGVRELSKEFAFFYFLPQDGYFSLTELRIGVRLRLPLLLGKVFDPQRVMRLGLTKILARMF
jgi:hypothetical protein